VDFPSGQVDPRNEPYRSMVLVAPDHIGAATGNLRSKVAAAAQGAISGKYLFAPGDVIYSKIRPYLRKAILADFEGLSSADMYPLRSRDGIVPRFLLAIILGEHFSRFAEIVSMRSGFPKINREEFSEYIVSVPSVPEQRRIAEILDTLDASIQKTEQLIAKLKQVKQGLLHDLLTCGIDENGELRDPARYPEQFKNSLLGRIPRAWQLAQLSSRLEVKGGKRLPAGHAYADAVTRYRYLRVQDFFGRSFDLDELVSLNEATFSALDRYEIHPGELYISIAGSIGHVGVYNPPVGVEARTILTENAARLVPVLQLVPEFVAAQMNSKFVQRQIEVEKGVGGGVPKLALFRIEDLMLIWPPPSEQKAIVDRLRALDMRLSCEEAELAKRYLLKQGLMEDLLTGCVRVTHLLNKATR
jgi:type I restriction enzyme S subunit